MKKFVSALFAAFAIVVFTASTSNAAPQVPTENAWCGACCGMINGAPVVGCGLVSPLVCGSACWCTNVPGVGFAC